MKYSLDLKKYAALARRTAAEGCVLLENREGALPLKKGAKTAVFGRAAFNYYKSGLGSGGLVNTRYTVSILDALKKEDTILVDARLEEIYKEWIADHPYDRGNGWGKVPWFQKEMPVTEEMLEIARSCDISLVIIGRTAGEDEDNMDQPGSWLLTEEEESLIRQVTENSRCTAVLLNTGNIIDMSWVKKYAPQAVMYVWQGGQEGGNAVADVLTGRVNPCGRLSDTIADGIGAYPSTENFGDVTRNYYREDVYVGYRYFETFEKERVLYPFGYGLSYTSFDIQPEIAGRNKESVTIQSVVKNTGTAPGREVLQVYAEVPQGMLGNPLRKLIGFAKTKELAPGSAETVRLEIPKYTFASYDDSGKTGDKSCYVLEAGVYRIYAGGNVRDAAYAGEFYEDHQVLERLEERCAPVRAFNRMRPQIRDGKVSLCYEETPLKSAEIRRDVPGEIPYTGDRGYKLKDVFEGKVTMQQFIAQLPDEELITMFRGEGMCSGRVTPGTASAFGGVSEGLEEFGIPAVCCADGPSGIRMDCGTKAFLLPCGTLQGCTFDPELIQSLYEMTGLELRLNQVDSLLGPGMNIHRNPLNGRNFEYISEDPLLTGKIAAAQTRGMGEMKIGNTIKHFCCNNQEAGRSTSDSVVSERALREIYLKGFEIAVKEGGARSVMTSYGAVNGLWTSGNEELCTGILRDEWGFRGIVMTDWWAKANYPGKDASTEAKTPMLLAQNDLYMCVPCPAENPEHDDVEEMLAAGKLSRGYLQRTAVNILSYILETPAMVRQMDAVSPDEKAAAAELKAADRIDDEIEYYEMKDAGLEYDAAKLDPQQGRSDQFGIIAKTGGELIISMEMCADLTPFAQIPVSVFCNEEYRGVIQINGTEGRWITREKNLGMIRQGENAIRFFYGADGLQIGALRLRVIPR